MHNCQLVRQPIENAEMLSFTAKGTRTDWSFCEIFTVVDMIL